ncbi:pectate lyase superfamily protein-domain-containing protein [Achaetomium macrosporum]|uniref:Pectate lyase superfamily protein-domain-containing protein n=1 Tax=Achaetomium macrosporum TaxID=79813 RepID=A0AAN7CBB9_9PEZI|nr:pectate lyase superfamily protein-domain-containing protein [Achaetomium macrosporum]
MALAPHRLVLFFLVSFLYVVQLVEAQSHHHGAPDETHRLLHAKANTSTLSPNGTAATVEGSAKDVIARFQRAMAVANEAILKAPKENVAKVQNSTTRQRKRTKARPLDYSGDFHQHANGTVSRRGGGNGTSTGATFIRESYTVPSEVAEAARIMAEANPLPPADYDALLADVRARMAKRKAHLNDTNVMPQKMQSSSGLVEYVPPAELAITVQDGIQVAGPQHPLRAAATTFWMETMTQRGSAPYAPEGYKVWRNVKDYGAYGDGVHDDTAAINRAISDGGRCGAGCPASTQFPATVYFPAGTYLVSSPIIQFYNTEMLGDPFNPPVIRAAESFTGLGVITSDVYVDDDVTWYLNQNNFLRSVRNFVMDIRPTPQWAYVCAIHWQVAQGTSLENIAFISTTPAEYAETTQQGIYMENGSGGFMSDLVFVGGNFGAYFGNQQFTTSGLLFDRCRTGLQIHWDWGWTMQDTEFYNCEKGIVIVGGAGGPMSTGQGVGSLSLVDVHMWGVPVAVETSLFADNSTALHISNGGFQNCATIVLDSRSNTVLYPGNGDGLTNVVSWGFGKVADPSGETGFINGADIAAPEYPASLLVADDLHPRPKLFHRTRPSYADPGNSQIFDVKALGAKGDGTTDDTAVLNHILDLAANVSGIVYFPHGVYVIRDTLEVPVGSRILGQAWPQIMATGANFQDMANPRAAVRVGAVGSVGVMEIQCMMFTVRGPTAGAVVVEWNVHESTQGSAGLWDSHIRVGGAKGSDLQKAECPKTAQNTAGCAAASLMMRMTEKSSGYLENVWMWVADHDMEDAEQAQINVYAARGMLIESQGPTWLWGTAAEHAVLYQYQLAGARNVVMGLIQTEAPYFQPSPKAPAPFERGLVFRDDPRFGDCPASSQTCAVAWSLRIVDSSDVYVISGGLYTWFRDYSQDCVNSGAHDCQLSTFYVEQSYDVWVYNLVTIGAVQMVTPLNGEPIIAAHNRNGFASSIVAWLGGANQTVGGRNITGYTLYTRDSLAVYDFSEQCKTALTGTLACAVETSQWTSAAYRGSLGNATLQDEVCDVGCRTSLASWYQHVSASCADYRWPSGAPLQMMGGYIWYGYNESCLTDSTTGRYCNDVINEFSVSETLGGMPDSELCSDCFTARIRMMQQSSYSIYNTVPWYQRAREAIQARCSLSLPADVPPPLIEVPTPKPFCVSDKYYTIKAGDSCNSIALANNVSSADVVYAAKAAGELGARCSALPAGLKICLPLTCATYSVEPTDSCLTISAKARIRDVVLYNRWIDASCDNLHEANATLGHVVCISPVGGTYTPGTATNTSGIPHGGSVGYSPVAVAPPAGATIAPGTIESCGRWYVAKDGDTCAYITMTHAIGLSLLVGMNPSINTKTAGGCSASIVPGHAYCVSLVSPWQGTEPDPPTFRTPTPKGCWSNIANTTDVLSGLSWTNDSMTLDSCARLCRGDGYPLAGFHDSSHTCFCGDRVRRNSFRVSASPCAAGSEASVSLYGLRDHATLSVPFASVGCFADAALVTDSEDAPSATPPNKTSVARCAGVCLPEYTYFGLSNGDTCRCGTGVADGATTLPMGENCNVPCSIRRDTTCGGSAATHIYTSKTWLVEDSAAS